MRILAFLQNQWFRDPARVKAIYERSPELRNRLIRSYLFMGCLTGRRLQAALGEDLCREITWEEVSPIIGGHASSKFAADLDHIRAAIEKHQPDTILSFGAIARSGLESVSTTATVIYGPHPASRQNAVKGLREVAEALQIRIRQYRSG